MKVIEAERAFESKRHLLINRFIEGHEVNEAEFKKVLEFLDDKTFNIEFFLKDLDRERNKALSAHNILRDVDVELLSTRPQDFGYIIDKFYEPRKQSLLSFIQLAYIKTIWAKQIIQTQKRAITELVRRADEKNEVLTGLKKYLDKTLIDSAILQDRKPFPEETRLIKPRDVRNNPDTEEEERGENESQEEESDAENEFDDEFSEESEPEQQPESTQQPAPIPKPAGTTIPEKLQRIKDAIHSIKGSDYSEKMDKRIAADEKSPAAQKKSPTEMILPEEKPMDNQVFFDFVKYQQLIHELDNMPFDRMEKMGELRAIWGMMSPRDKHYFDVNKIKLINKLKRQVDLKRRGLL